MENKVLKKILVMAIVFVIVFSNCGLTVQALATSEGFSFFGFKLFAKNNLKYSAYFLDESGNPVDEISSDVNKEVTLVLDLEPQEVGYLKTGTIKATTDEGVPNFEFKEILNLVSDNEEVGGTENEKSETPATNEVTSNNVTQNETTEEKEESSLLQQSVPVQQTLLQTSQMVTTDLPQHVNLGENQSQTTDTNVVENTVTTENTVVENQNTVPTENTQKTENTVTTQNTIVDDNNTVAPENTVSNENTVSPNTATETKPGNTIIPETTNENKAPELSVMTPPPTLDFDPDVMINEDQAYQDEIKEKEDENTLQTPMSSTAKVVSEDEIVVENIINPTKVYVKIAYKKSEPINTHDLKKLTNLKFEGTYINEDLEEVAITAADSVDTQWTYTKDINVSSEVGKVSAFEVEGTKGTIVEGKVTVSRNCTEEIYLPLKETVVEIQVPDINGKQPIALDVSATKLKATRGEEINQVNFTKDNWIYDENKKTITITVKNPEKVLTSGEDIYTFTCRYEEYVGAEEINVDLRGNVTVEEYSGASNNIITKVFADSKNTIVNVGELITYSIGTTEDTISKGLINANYNSVEAVYQADFVSTVGINILTNDILEEFTIKDMKEYYITKDNVEFEANDIRYKAVKFRYNEIMSLIDNGGIIEIRANTGEVLHTLSKENTNSQENCDIVLNGDIHGVEISVRNVSENGTYTIDFVKTLGKCAYEKQAFNTFEKIESRIAAEVKYQNVDAVIPLTPLKTEKYFEKSYTKAELTMNKEELSTTTDNENVEFKIELFNNNEKSDLYINPEFELVFPNYVQNVEVNSVNLLYEDGLTVKNVTIFRDEANLERMKISLEGVQRTFSTSDATNGTNIIINAKVQIDDYAPRKDDQVKMYYFNQGVTNYQSQTDWKISSQTPEGIIKTTNGFDIEVFSYKAPIGFITTNAIENYDGLGSSVESIAQGDITAKIDMGEVSRPVIMNLAAMNNTGNECTDVVMIGRIPNIDATDVITGEKLGTNRNTQLLSGIVQADSNPIGCKIYYSQNPKATQDINDINNNWTDRLEEVEQVKSYAIVPTGTVAPGTQFKFSYTFQVPANLPYEVELYGSFGAFYNNHSDVAVMYETSKADMVGLVTEVGPKLEASLSVNIGDGKDVGEARYIKYSVDVANTGSEMAKDVQVVIAAPNYTTLQAHTKENGYGNDNYLDANAGGMTGFVGDLEPGERATYNYYVKTNNIPAIGEYYYKTLGVSIKQDEKGYYYEVPDGTGTTTETKPENTNENTVENTETNADGNTTNSDSVVIVTPNMKKVYVDEKYDVYIENSAIVKAANFGDEITTNSTKNKLVKSDWDMVVNTECLGTITTGQEFTFKNSFRNISGQDLEDVVVTIKLPETVVYMNEDEIIDYDSKTKYSSQYDEATHTVTVKFDKILKEASTSTYIGVRGKTGNKEKLETFFTISAKGRKEEKSTVLLRKYEGPNFVVQQTTDIVNSVKEDEEVKLTITIENTGEFMAENFVIQDIIPENLVKPAVEVYATNSSRKAVEPGEKFVYRISKFAKGEKAVINIIGKAARLEGTAKTISNKAEITANYIDPITTNVININIEENPNKGSNQEYNNEGESSDYIDDRTNAEMKDKEQSGNTQNPNPSNNNGSSSNNNNNAQTNNNGSSAQSSSSNNNNNNNSANNNTANNNQSNNQANNQQQAQVEKIHTIKGTVWLDANTNNRRDPEESGIPEVSVELFQGRSVVATTKTNAAGAYEFRSLANGEYTVNFKYDGEKYIAAEYKGADIEEDLNSDAMNYADGTAATNTLKIENLNLENINCGLQDRDKFDLTVEKFIKKSIVTAKGKETVKEYDNLDLTKIDLDAKKIANSTVKLEYNIVVTNSGNVPGKALKLVDHLPKDMQFDEKENQGWYAGSDGKLYNESLKETNIAPGDSKEIKLVLTRTMNTENTGVISNLIEIAEAESAMNIQEKKENNTATQETILSIRTGGSLVPITVLFTIMALLTYAITTGKLIIKIENDKLNVKFNTKKIYK